MTNIASSLAHITINGELRSMHASSMISDIISQLNLDTRKIAIEQNGAIVPRSLYGSTSVVPGDAIEIVGFIGGG